ncbi:MAG: TIM44-like domain-containing protein, partial [Roseomonas sp.]|nr:TIM44-like domain-containing protein [Roseomonas sp.]
MTKPVSRRRRGAAIFAAFAVVALAIAPAIAEAKPGGNTSSGSRGSRTQSAPPSTQTAPGSAQQFQRTETAPARPAAPGVAQPAARPAGATGGFLSRNPMMAGLMGGLLGAGLFGLLSGSGLFGGMAGFMGFLGLMLQIALIAGLVFLVMRLVRGRRPAMAGMPNTHARDAQGMAPRGGMMGGMMGGMGGAAAVSSQPLDIAGADFEAFGQRLVEINAAWSRQDLATLRRLSTPEMERYFAQDLSDLQARGWTNVTRDVQLEAGDLSEAWTENGQDYATVAMRFSLVDVTTDATGKVVEGHPTERQTSTE